MRESRAHYKSERNKIARDCALPNQVMHPIKFQKTPESIINTVVNVKDLK